MSPNSGFAVQHGFTTSHSRRHPWLSHAVQLPHVNYRRSQSPHFCATICSHYTLLKRSRSPCACFGGLHAYNYYKSASDYYHNHPATMQKT
jgi:hypothetical protein